MSRKLDGLTVLAAYTNNSRVPIHPIKNNRNRLFRLFILQYTSDIYLMYILFTFTPPIFYTFGQLKRRFYIS